MVPLFTKVPGTLPTTQVKLTAREAAPPASSAALLFLQPVASNAQPVLSTITSHLRKKHSAWSGKTHVVLSGEPEIAPNDAPAAALAAALLLDAMIAGWEPDPGCAAMGGLQADGSISPVSWALTRLTTAIRAGAKRILVAESNASEAGDCLLNEGPAAFARTQMFAVGSFEEAPDLAAAVLSGAPAKAAAAFDEVAAALAASGADSETKLRDPEIQDKLRSVLIAVPSHLSARLLLRHSTRRGATFSLPGSLEVVERVAPTLLPSLRSGRPSEVKDLPADRILDEVTKLRTARDRIDARALGWLQSVINYGDLAQSWHEAPPDSVLRTRDLLQAMQKTARAAQAEHQKLVKIGR
jgi:hypothetical protein